MPMNDSELAAVDMAAERLATRRCRGKGRGSTSQESIHEHRQSAKVHPCYSSVINKQLYIVFLTFLYASLMRSLK